MRIGQVLIEAELISAKQLSTGLEYGKAKKIALGRVMKLLKYMEDDDVERALQAQKLIRLGLSPLIAVEALKLAVKQQVGLEQALQERYASHLPPAEESPASVEAVPVDRSQPPLQLIDAGDKFLIEDQCVEAEAYYLAAKSLMEEALGESHIDLCQVLIRLGNTYMATDRFSQAEEMYKRVLEVRKGSLPEDHPHIAQSLESLADLYRAWGDEKQTMELFLKALDILEGHLPQQLGFYAAILRKVTAVPPKGAEDSKRQMPVGELLKAAGILSEGQLNHALKMSKQQNLPLGIVLRENCIVTDRELQSALKSQFCIKHGVLSVDLAVDLLARASRRGISLERLLHEAGVLASDESKYEVYSQIAIELDKLVAVETSAVACQKDAAPIAYKLGSLYEQAGDQAQAELYYSRALKTWGADTRGDLTAARTCMALARIHQAQNRNEEVVPLLLKALEHRKHALGPNHEETIATVEEIAELEIEQKDYKAALEHLRDSIACRESLGQDGAKLLKPVVLLGDCLTKVKDYEEAKVAYTRAMTIVQSKFGGGSHILAAVIERLGDMYLQQDLQKTAIAQFNYALMIFQAAGKLDCQAAQNLKEKLDKLNEQVKEQV